MTQNIMAFRVHQGKANTAMLATKEQRTAQVTTRQSLSKAQVPSITGGAVIMKPTTVSRSNTNINFANDYNGSGKESAWGLHQPMTSLGASPPFIGVKSPTSQDPTNTKFKLYTSGGDCTEQAVELSRPGTQ